jgi:hypothetical protein
MLHSLHHISLAFPSIPPISRPDFNSHRNSFSTTSHCATTPPQIHTFGLIVKQLALVCPTLSSLSVLSMLSNPCLYYHHNIVHFSPFNELCFLYSAPLLRLVVLLLSTRRVFEACLRLGFNVTCNVLVIHSSLGGSLRFVDAKPICDWLSWIYW